MRAQTLRKPVQRGNFFTIMVGERAGTVLTLDMPRHGFVLEARGIAHPDDWMPIAWVLSPWGPTLEHWQRQLTNESREYRVLVGSGEWIASLNCWSGSARDTLDKFKEINAPKLDVDSTPRVHEMLIAPFR